MKKKYTDALMEISKFTEAEVNKICIACGNDKARIIKYINLAAAGTSFEEIQSVITKDSIKREAAAVLQLDDENVVAYNVQENMITLKTGDLIEAVENTKAIVSAEIQAIGNHDFRANDYLIILDPFNRQSMVRIIRVAYRKDPILENGEKKTQISTIIICAEGTPWE